jgi:hypothetical protein
MNGEVVREFFELPEGACDFVRDAGGEVVWKKSGHQEDGRRVAVSIRERKRAAFSEDDLTLSAKVASSGEWMRMTLVRARVTATLSRAG